MIFENGTIYKGGVRIGEGDVLISPNGFKETVMWSGLTLVATNMRNIAVDSLIESGNYDIESIYTKEKMEDIESFLSKLRIFKDEDHKFVRKGNGNLLEISIKFPTMDQPNGGRSVSLYVGSEDGSDVKVMKELTFVKLEDNRLVFYYGRYFKLVKGIEIINEDGKMKINKINLL